MMRWLRLGLTLLRRERASGEWRILLLALVIGVGSVSTTGFLGDRLKRAMTERGAGFLGADLLVTSPRPIQAWPDHDLDTSQAIELASMASRGDLFQLVTLRAVDAAWPLRGQVRIAQRPFEDGQPGPALPPPGDIYVETGLLSLLDAQVGDRVRIGASEFRIGGLVADEPGRIGGIFGLAPRVFLRADALAATQVLQPGSRITYLYQFAGAPEAIEGFARALKPRLDNTQRLTGAREGSQVLRGPFANADRYIQLTALISLLLSVAAVAIAARRHALRHYDQAALLRCLGATTGQLRTLYASQWLLLGLLGSLLGVGLGALAQQGLAALLLPEAAWQLPELGWAPVGAGMLSGLLALAGASLPYLLRLSQTPPLRVLRRDLPPLPLAAWLSAAITGTALTGLVLWYAQDAQLVAVFLGALAALVLTLAILARLALAGGRWVRRLSAGPLRFGLAQLLRHRLDSTLQLGAFTLALFLLALLTLVRTDLVHGWRQQLPADAPNHFLVNIAPHQQQEVSAYLAKYPIKSSDLYPMIRGKLVTRNGQPITEGLSEAAREDNTLRRELNLTWTGRLPANNEILAGTWHGNRPGDEISVEARMAERLGLALGDRLGFQVGDQTVEARITSLRSVQWESLQPNFFVIFAPGPLETLPASGLAAIHVPPEARDALTGFVKAFPGITVLALDKLMNDIQAVFDQIIAALQLLLGFLLAAGMAVVLATLLASLDARQQEAVLLRTLGAPRAFLAKSLWSEFLALGALAGLLASACAEIAMALIAQRLFELSPQWHPLMWISLPLAGALLVGAGGWLTTRQITRIPPMQSIRALS